MSIGVDIEDISRFEGKSQHFLDRIFTKNEQEYCLSKAKPASHFAARFCAKEATIKALTPLGLKYPQFNQIEVYHSEKDFPKIRLIDFDKKLTIEVSLSHDRTKAVAFVQIVEKEC